MGCPYVDAEPAWNQSYSLVMPDQCRQAALLYTPPLAPQVIKIELATAGLYQSWGHITMVNESEAWQPDAEKHFKPIVEYVPLSKIGDE